MMISKHTLKLILLALIWLAGTGIIDDTIDICQYFTQNVNMALNSEPMDTKQDQINFLGERVQARRNREDKRLIYLASCLQF